MGCARGAAPLVKIWDTLYIYETITARKSKILQALRYCQMLFSGVKSFLLGACQGRSTPNVNLGSDHISETIRARKLKFYIHLGRVKYSFWNVKFFRKVASQGRSAP